MAHLNVKKARLDSFLLLLDTFARLGAAFIVSIAIARIYGPDGLGAITAASSLAILIIGFSTLGLNGVLVQEYIKRPERAASLLVTVTFGKLASGLFLLALLWGALAFLNVEPSVVILTILIAAGYIFTAFDTIESYHHSQATFRWLVTLRLTAIIVSAVFKLFVVMAKVELYWVAVAFGAEYILLYIIPATHLYFCVKFGQMEVDGAWILDFSLLWNLLRRTWPMILSGGLAQVNLRADVILLAALAPFSEAGLYAAASRLSDAWAMVGTSIVNAHYPHLARAGLNNIEQYALQLSNLIRKLIWTAVCAATAVTLLAEKIVEGLYGREFQGAGAVLSVHIMGGAFLFVRAVVSKWLIIENLLMFSLVSHASAAIVNVSLNLILIPACGAIGAAWSSVASYAVGGLLFLAATRTTRLMLLMVILSIFPGRFFRAARCQLAQEMMERRRNRENAATAPSPDPVS